MWQPPAEQQGDKYRSMRENFSRDFKQEKERIRRASYNFISENVEELETFIISF